MLPEKEIVDTASPTSDREIIISRVLNAPVELVWEVWTNPEHIKNWWGPNGFTNTIFEMDVKVGGIWDFVMHGPDGTDYKNKSVYKELVKYKRIVFEHVSGPHFTATIDFERRGDKTFLKWQMLFNSREEFLQVIKTFKADEGLKQNIYKLEGYLQEVENKHPNMSEDVLVFEKTFDAPVEKVWRAITDVDQMKQWYFPQLEQFKAEVGFETQFNVHHAGKDYLHIWKITEVVPLKKISLLWSYGGYPGQSLIRFELFADASKTKLILTHSGIDTFMPKKYPELGKENFTKGWTQFIEKALKEFLQKVSG